MNGDRQPPRIEVLDEPSAAMYRAMTPAQRIAIVASAYRTARQLARSGIRLRQPDWTEEQIEQGIAQRMCRGTT
jgi:hypothetical protein